MSQDNPWNNDLYVRYYLDMMQDRYPESQTEREANFLESVMDLTYGDNLLDICSGCGRHEIAMAKRGYNVTGVDTSQQLIQHSEELAKDSPVDDRIDFMLEDGRNLPNMELDKKYQGAFILASLGFHMKDQDCEDILQGVYTHLQPGGYFVVDVKNRESLLREFNEKNWIRTSSGFTCLRKTKFDFETSCTINHKYVTPPEGGEELFHQWMRSFTLKELLTLLEKVGFEPQRIYGDFKRGPYNIQSPRMIVVATKETEERAQA